METKVYDSYADFSSRKNKKENGVSKEFAKLHPNWEKENETNTGCWNCVRCSDCSDCSDCVRCSDCFDCSRCSDCVRCSEEESKLKV